MRYFLGSSGGVFDDGKRAVEGGQKCWIREGSGWGVTDQVGGASARVELVWRGDGAPGPLGWQVEVRKKVFCIFVIFLVRRAHISDIMYRHIAADEAVDELRSLVDFLQLRVNEEQRFRRGQRERVQKCAELLRKCLEGADVPSAGGVKVEEGELVSRHAIREWIEGRPGEVEGYYQEQPREGVQEIEDELVREFLREKKPGYQWQVYQVDIVRRVQQRAKKRRVVVELSALTDVVAGRLREFSVSEKGERSKRGFVHEYTSRERYW